MSNVHSFERHNFIQSLNLSNEIFYFVEALLISFKYNFQKYFAWCTHILGFIQFSFLKFLLGWKHNNMHITRLFSMDMHLCIQEIVFLHKRFVRLEGVLH